MLLKTADGSELELTVVGYQSPDALDEMDDWLVMFIRLKVGSESWKAEDPALLWQEARDLSKWLDGVARDDSRGGWSIGFLEPVLLFEAHRLTRDSIALQIYCQKFPRLASGDHFSKIFEFSREQLKKAAEELRLELEQFPSRFSLDESEDSGDDDEGT